MRSAAESVPFTIDFDIIDDPTAFAALREEWDALYARARGAYFTQTFFWCETCWRIEDAQEARLFIIRGRKDGRTILIWPFSIRTKKLMRLARQMGQRSTEYAALLIDAQEDAPALARQALCVLKARCPADLISLPYVPDDDALAQALGGDAIVMARAGRKLVSWEGGLTWETYFAAMNAGRRKSLNRRFRRLSELGELSFVLLTEPDDIREAVDWIIARKLEWRKRMKLPNVWRRTENWRAIKLHVACDPRGREHVRIFELRSNGERIAAEVTRGDSARIEGITSAYDEAFAIYSPAEILTRYVLEWGSRRALAYDFRIGDEPYKDYWVNRQSGVSSYYLPRSLAGSALIRLYLAFRAVRNVIGRSLSALKTAKPAAAAALTVPLDGLLLLAMSF